MCRNIFSVQHTLTSNVTGSRENSLDQAKQYYEMLNLRPQVKSIGLFIYGRFVPGVKKISLLNVS